MKKQSKKLICFALAVIMLILSSVVPMSDISIIKPLTASDTSLDKTYQVFFEEPGPELIDVFYKQINTATVKTPFTITT